MAVAMLLSGAAVSPVPATSVDARVDALAQEVRKAGWLIYGARSDNGTWDLFVSRPDGSAARNLTNTPDYEEAGPRVAPDGTRMLFRRMPRDTKIDHDKWGFQGQLVLSSLDAKQQEALGDEGEYPWASWSPDSKQIACLTLKGIQFVDLATRKVVRTLPRLGMFQQLYWSPDGKWFCGVSNHFGSTWTIARMDAATGDVNAVREHRNCTPDWCPDSEHIIMSSRPQGQTGDNGYGYTQLWIARGDGSDQRLVYGEDGAHIYGGAQSPDGRYALFTSTPKDGSGAAKNGGIIGIMRMADAPSIGGPSPDLRIVHPDTKDGPVLWLGKGWEPFWTNADMGVQ